MSKIDVEGVCNIRDLGGFTTRDGATIKHAILIRSANLDQLPEASQKELIDYGVKTVIDLRDEWEQAKYPNVFSQHPQIHYHNIPLLGDDLESDAEWQLVKDDYTELHELYIKYLEWHKPQIGRIITAIAEAESTTIVHCYAGKDRTGIITALLLHAIGVPEIDIAQDYGESRAGIAHLVEQWREYALRSERDMEQFERDVDANPQTILSLLSYIHQTYGTTNAYLRSCHVGEDTIQKLRDKFLR